MYINHLGNIVVHRDFSYLDKEMCGTAFKKDDKVLKLYFKDTLSEHRLDYEVFELLNELNSDHFIKIYELYTNLKSYLQYRFREYEFYTQGYLAQYYKSDDINILTMEKEYILENMYEIEKVVKEFTKEYIEVKDLSTSNTIFTKDRMIIIDPDCFKREYYGIYSTCNNDRILENYFIGLYYDFFKRLCNGEDYALPGKVCSYMIDWFKNAYKSKSVTDNISLLLKDTKRPIDLFK